MATAMQEQARGTSPTPYEEFDSILVDGTWRRGGGDRVVEDRDPYTGDVLVRIPSAGERDLDEAYRAADAAQAAWAARGPSERSGVLRRAASIMEDRRAEIVDWLVRGVGQHPDQGGDRVAIHPRHDARGGDLPVAVGGGDPPDRHRRQGEPRLPMPVGVVGMISPWNFPLHLSNRSIAPALALGNAAVIKPASDTPVTGGLLLAKIYEEAGLPPGVLNVVVAPGGAIGDKFVLHPVPRVISFTGSTEVGKHIAELAARGPMLKKVALELGGNSPTVVLDDADLGLAVDAAVFGKFLHQGQICMATNRLIVDAKVHDEFVDRFTDRVRGLKVGNPNDEDTVIGPVINEGQLKRLREHIEKARAEGARQVVGGEPLGARPPAPRVRRRDE